MSPRFCPRCHRLVELPAFLKTGRVKVEGSIKLGCGNCGKGKVTLRAVDLPAPIEAVA